MQRVENRRAKFFQRYGVFAKEATISAKNTGMSRSKESK